MRDPRLTFGELGNDILEDLCVVPVTECWHIDDGPSIGLGQRAPGMRFKRTRNRLTRQKIRSVPGSSSLKTLTHAQNNR